MAFEKCYKLSLVQLVFPEAQPANQRNTDQV
jgi:hypothetical protein